MICPNCEKTNSKTIDSRKRPHYTRRRKQCLNCEHRWSTLEVPRDYFKFLQAGMREVMDEMNEIRKDVASKLLDHGFDGTRPVDKKNLEKAREVLRQKRANEQAKNNKESL